MPASASAEDNFYVNVVDHDFFYSTCLQSLIYDCKLNHSRRISDQQMQFDYRLEQKAEFKLKFLERYPHPVFCIARV